MTPEVRLQFTAASPVPVCEHYNLSTAAFSTTGGILLCVSKPENKSPYPAPIECTGWSLAEGGTYICLFAPHATQHQWHLGALGRADRPGHCLVRA